MSKKKDAYEKFAGAYKNEADFEEELIEEDLNPLDAEKQHFEEIDEPAI